MPERNGTPSAVNRRWSATHVSALIGWSAVSGGRRIEGRELAVYEVRGGLITAAWLHPENIGDDRAFWGEGRLDEPGFTRLA